VLSLRGLGPWSQILVIGTGAEALDAVDLQVIGALAARETSGTGGPVHIVSNGIAAAGDAGAQVALGAALASYRFDRYRSADPKRPAKNEAASPLRVVAAGPAAEAAWRDRGAALAESVAFVRDLVAEPANVIYPESFVERTRTAFRGIRNVEIEVVDVPAMQRMGMNALLAVGQGSTRPPRLLAVHYRGAGGRPIALAGKGITFDSGGISLKNPSGMWEMKGDMSGAGAVVGAVLALARARAPVHVVAVAALAENLPSGSATRPGDVVKAMNGRSIEILNTDAEGRLVLADGVAYAERQYRPLAIVDVATLTGAKVTALGDEYAALFSRQDGLAEQLLAAGDATGEALWRMPLHANYAKDMKSDVADIKNVVEGGAPGSGFGAHFIGSFVSEATPWAHLDIAGNEIAEKVPLAPTGVTGFGVRLLEHFVRNFRPVAQPGAAAAARTRR
jgi:leucyl aminopeptidase